MYDFAICQGSLESWIKSQLNDPNYMTIPELAKQLGINQESAYQLVNFGLIEYNIIDNTRFISQKNLDIFNQQYILLSHYAKEQKINSRYLLKKLAEEGIFPIGSELENKLRRQVYLKEFFL